MNRDQFLEALRAQYIDEIKEVYAECDHASGLDLQQLSKRLSKLKKIAKVEGLPEGEFQELVKSLYPELNFKKAA